MLKIYTDDIRLKGAKLIKNSTCGSVFRLKTGEFYKLFDPFLKLLLNEEGNLERKIMSAEPIEDVPEIIIPTCGVYSHIRREEFVGYITPPAEGVNFNDYDQNYTLEQRSNLVEYGSIFYTMSDIVQRGNENRVVFPDLCTCDNIFIAGGRISFIDYDGLQVGRHRVYTMSTTLGDEEQYYHPKYCKKGLFTPELDKKSLVLLYFLSAFGVDLKKAGKKNPMNGQVITLSEVFDLIGLRDYDFMQKVHNTLSQNKPGEYIGDDVVRIGEEYTMKCFGEVAPGYYLKKVYKK